MFHFDITCEDTRLIAYELQPNAMKVRLTDNQSGKQHVLPSVTHCQLEKIISAMICCHGDLPVEEYPEIEKILEGCPAECRPIP